MRTTLRHASDVLVTFRTFTLQWPTCSGSRWSDHRSTPLRSADRVWWLGDLGPDAHHERGRVLGEFHELVLLEQATGTARLVVASSD